MKKQYFLLFICFCGILLTSSTDCGETATKRTAEGRVTEIGTEESVQNDDEEYKEAIITDYGEGIFHIRFPDNSAKGDEVEDRRLGEVLSEFFWKHPDLEKGSITFDPESKHRLWLLCNTKK